MVIFSYVRTIYRNKYTEFLKRHTYICRKKERKEIKRKLQVRTKCVANMNIYTNTYTCVTINEDEAKLLPPHIS